MSPAAKLARQTRQPKAPRKRINVHLDAGAEKAIKRAARKCKVTRARFIAQAAYMAALAELTKGPTD